MQTDVILLEPMTKCHTIYYYTNWIAIYLLVATGVVCNGSVSDSVNVPSCVPCYSLSK